MSSRRLAVAHSSSRTVHIPSTTAGSPSSSATSTQVSSPVPKLPVGLDLVVEAEHRRGRAAPEDAAGRRRALGERVEPERGRAASWVGVGMRQAGGRDDAERALRADEELGEVRAHRLAGLAAREDPPAVGEHHVEADHDVLDLAVAGRVLAGAAARQPATHGGQRHRLGPVADRVTRGRAGARPRSGRRTSRPGRRRSSDASSTSTMPDRPHMSRTTPPNTGTALPHTPGPPGGRGQRDSGLVADRRDRGDLVGVGGPCHDSGALRRPLPRWPTSSPAATSHGSPRPVAAGSVVTDVAGLGQAGDDVVAGTSTAVVRETGDGAGRATGERDRWSGYAGAELAKHERNQ